jgi:hypothetical protein
MPVYFSFNCVCVCRGWGCRFNKSAVLGELKRVCSSAVGRRSILKGPHPSHSISTPASPSPLCIPLSLTITSVLFTAIPLTDLGAPGNIFSLSAGDVASNVDAKSTPPCDTMADPTMKHTSHYLPPYDSVHCHGCVLSASSSLIWRGNDV